MTDDSWQKEMVDKIYKEYIGARVTEGTYKNAHSKSTLERLYTIKCMLNARYGHIIPEEKKIKLPKISVSELSIF